MTVESKTAVRCAIYTRKSSEEGLEQSFNSLDLSGKLPKPSSSVSATKGGECYLRTTMTAAIPVDP
jgi:hypothetical protein